jgi:hypothetical protein
MTSPVIGGGGGGGVTGGIPFGGVDAELDPELAAVCVLTASATIFD